jgi:membrane protein YdbS with pleckstrin-like domain
VETDESVEAGQPHAGAMTPLHPNFVWVMRIRAAILAFFLTTAGWFADAGLLRETPLPAGLLPGLVALLALIGLVVLPTRRYRAWGYREEEDELHIRFGLWTRFRTVVPFGRVQHIDIASGPIERRFGLATLILHTAGTRGAAVPLPGLAHDLAESMRDRIRVKIRQELV